MRIDILTLFPEMCESVLGESIIGRARKDGFVEINCRQIRDYSTDKHKRVDDTPYGGGMGMIMQCEPIYNCYKAVCEDLGTKPHTIYMSPKGNVLTEQRAVELSKMDNILIICGHYEGVDQRIVDEIIDEEISIGDYVLTGGELPACILVDCISRLLPGVLSDKECYESESIACGMLEYPQYTRPYEFHGVKVPDVLISGDHAKVDKWRREQAEKLTKERRPDLIDKK